MLQAVQVEKMAGEILRIVLSRVESGRLVVPAMPATAAKCIQLLRTPDFQIKRVVVQLEIDPVLALLVMREACKAANGTSIKTLDAAVSRLGADRMKSLVTTYAAHELFESRNPQIKAANRKIWEHSLACALLARDLAGFANIDGDTSYLGGLLHDIGKPVFSAMMLEAERKLGNGNRDWIDPTLWMQHIGSSHRKIGVSVATMWGLSPDVQAAIRDSSDYDANERACPANVVRLANAIAKREGYTTEQINVDDVDAMIMVGRSMLGIDEDVIGRLGSGLKARLTQAME